MRYASIILCLLIVLGCMATKCSEESCPSIGCGPDLTIRISEQKVGEMANETFKIELFPGVGGIDEIVCEPTETEIVCSYTDGDHTVTDHHQIEDGPLELGLRSKDERPDELKIVVTSNNSPVMDETFTLIFDEYDPNGIECAGPCYSTEIELSK